MDWFTVLNNGPGAPRGPGSPFVPFAPGGPRMPSVPFYENNINFDNSITNNCRLQELYQVLSDGTGWEFFYKEDTQYCFPFG